MHRPKTHLSIYFRLTRSRRHGIMHTCVCIEVPFVYPGTRVPPTSGGPHAHGSTRRSARCRSALRPTGLPRVPLSRHSGRWPVHVPPGRLLPGREAPGHAARLEGRLRRPGSDRPVVGARPRGQHRPGAHRGLRADGDRYRRARRRGLGGRPRPPADTDPAHGPGAAPVLPEPGRSGAERRGCAAGDRHPRPGRVRHRGALAPRQRARLCLGRPRAGRGGDRPGAGVGGGRATATGRDACATSSREYSSGTGLRAGGPAVPQSWP